MKCPRTQTLIANDSDQNWSLASWLLNWKCFSLLSLAFDFISLFFQYQGKKKKKFNLFLLSLSWVFLLYFDCGVREGRYQVSNWILAFGLFQASLSLSASWGRISIYVFVLPRYDLRKIRVDKNVKPLSAGHMSKRDSEIRALMECCPGGWFWVMCSEQRGSTLWLAPAVKEAKSPGWVGGRRTR